MLSIPLTVLSCQGWDRDILIALKMSIPMIFLVLLINAFLAILSKVAQTMNLCSFRLFIVNLLGIDLFSFVLPNIGVQP